MDYQEYSLFGPLVFSYHGYGSLELVHFGGAPETNSRMGSCKHIFLRNIFFYHRSSITKGGTLMDQQFNISPSMQGLYPKSGLHIPSNSGKIERACALLEG
jgi:hypothetical protein